MASKVDIEIGLRAQNALAGLQAFAGRFQAALMTLTGGAGLVGIIRRGVQFNSLLEDTQESLGAILVQFRPKQFATFADALRQAGKMVEELKVKATQTKGSLSDLAESYSTLAPAMFTANVPIERQLDLMVMLSNAVGVVARGSNTKLQLMTEGRSLLAGQFGPDAALARMLFPSRSEQDAYRSAIKAGRALDVLMSKLEPFAEMGRRAGQTFSGRLSNLIDKFDQVLGESTLKTFDSMKDVFLQLERAISSQTFRDGIRVLMDFVASVAKFAADLAAQADLWGPGVKAYLKSVHERGALGAGGWRAGREAAQQISKDRVLAALGLVLADALPGGRIESRPEPRSESKAEAGKTSEPKIDDGRMVAEEIRFALRGLAGDFWRTFFYYQPGGPIARGEGGRSGAESSGWSTVGTERSGWLPQAPSAPIETQSALDSLTQTQLSKLGDVIASLLDGLRGPIDRLATQSRFATFGESVAARRTTNLGERMLDEVRRIREVLAQGVKLDQATL